MFLRFSRKNTKKTSQTAVRKKHRKRILPGPLLGPKIDEKLYEKSQKSPKSRKKVVFWGCRFLMFFFDAFFLKFWKISTPGIRLNLKLDDLFPPNPLQGACALKRNFNRAESALSVIPILRDSKISHIDPPRLSFKNSNYQSQTPPAQPPISNLKSSVLNSQTSRNWTLHLEPPHLNSQISSLTKLKNLKSQISNHKSSILNSQTSNLKIPNH